MSIVNAKTAIARREAARCCVEAGPGTGAPRCFEAADDGSDARGDFARGDFGSRPRLLCFDLPLPLRARIGLALFDDEREAAAAAAAEEEEEEEDFALPEER
jgi:hypothetical protein